MAWRRAVGGSEACQLLLRARGWLPLSFGGWRRPPSAAASQTASLRQWSTLSANDLTPSQQHPDPRPYAPSHPLLFKNLCSHSAPTLPFRTPRAASSASPPFRGQSVRTKVSNASEFDLITVDVQLARVDMYYPGGFTVNNVQMPGPVFLCDRLSLLWRAPPSVEQLSPQDLPLISLIKPSPDFMVIGTGESYKPISKELHEFLKECAISVEVLDTVNAAATFNILNQESRNVAACLFTI